METANRLVQVQDMRAKGLSIYHSHVKLVKWKEKNDEQHLISSYNKKDKATPKEKYMSII